MVLSLGSVPIMIATIVLLAGCGTDGIYVPVVGPGERTAERGDAYVVKRGDTLYSIAFRYGLDYKELAKANRIPPPYTIFVDQRLRLTAAVPDEPDGAPATAVTTGKTGNTAAPRTSRPPPAVSAPPDPVEAPQVADSGIRWDWPYEGEVVAAFSLSGKVNKGIDIRGRSGDPVRSSADGVVVYAGGGLRGYGKLVIVKHNDRYLSAYGHNESIVVKEGDKVRQGQVVARIGGASGTGDVLHFEIRRDGKPRDPLQYLPPRTGD